jgi:hypothetical protein
MDEGVVLVWYNELQGSGLRMNGATGNGAFGVENLNSNLNVLVEGCFVQKDLEIGEIVDNEDTASSATDHHKIEAL